MAQAATEKLDLLTLTGDIIHFPSPASVDFVLEQIGALGVPAMYTCGNHDVHYTNEPVNDEVRLTRLAALQPLHNGDPDGAAREVGGIRFVPSTMPSPRFRASRSILRRGNWRWVSPPSCFSIGR